MTQISFLSRVLDLVAPRPCAMCERRLGISEATLCAGCNMVLPRTDHHLRPFDNELVRLFWGRIPIEKGAAFFLHMSNSPSSHLIYKLKYFDRPDIGVQLGRLVATEYAAENFFDDITTLLPVPLTRRRIMQRGYNQSLEIARGISNITGLPIARKAVRRTSFMESQTRKDLWERTQNVKNAFALCDGAALNNCHVLLIDDVITTGATLTAIGKALAKVPNIKISVLSLCFANDK